MLNIVLSMDDTAAHKTEFLPPGTQSNKRGMHYTKTVQLKICPEL